MNLFVWKILLTMKLILCFAALLAVYLIDANAAPALGAQDNGQSEANVLSSNLMVNLDSEGQIELQRRKRRSNDMVCINSMVCDPVSYVT